MTTLKQSANFILKKLFEVKKNERVLIVTDKIKQNLGKLFYNQAKKLSDDAGIIKIPVGKIHGEEPPGYAADAMKKTDVLLLITEKSMSHTTARKRATQRGARIASMPGITAGMLRRSIILDYNKMNKTKEKIMNRLRKAKKCRVITKKGTDITFKIPKIRYDKRKKHGLRYKGHWNNLPAGEAYFYPIAANGIFVIDASILDKKVDKPIKITVKNRYAVRIEGGRLAAQLRNTLKRLRDRNSYHIAELGIGVNPKAKLTGNILEDEKVLGTCHIALGSSFAIGGKIKAKCHLDGVIKKPTMIVDKKTIIKEGKLQI
ncbi:aminopeptidase [Candidatus Woesearchaeota archaeon]|nr:aminopeptidase [Candidatus Woesearchaeota archaeon]